MTRIDGILARARLATERTAPRDIVDTVSYATAHAVQPSDAHPRPAASGRRRDAQEAAEDLRALCETLVSHTPAHEIADFVTEQIPEPRSALILACVLQMTDTDDGARFWWQYAAGAGQPAAAYCLYLHHLAVGEDAPAHWWHQQTDDVKPPPPPPASTPRPGAVQEWAPALNPVTSTSTTTILRILRHLAKQTVRDRTTAVTRLMAYIPTAVTVGYLREPDMELPLPGDDFAQRVKDLLAAAACRPDVLPVRTSQAEQDLDLLQQAASH
ncbi:hypothetical protein [Streptomyces lasalocidi]|uniref:Uncharacterized protein n=1 Tax=Streptomyces lasalocidi TaxID=324833 RepID=A0A4U5WC14_STRLS|nr:hypothetical protein [Streptomyces lasalocidi]TKS98701.1 hypothetical protein E4U91_00105 [Streptomyces lasalocidi]